MSRDDIEKKQKRLAQINKRAMKTIKRKEKNAQIEKQPLNTSNCADYVMGDTIGNGQFLET